MTLIKCTLTFFVALTLAACGADGPVSAERYASVDPITQTIVGNVSEADGLTLAFDIDHSRLAAAAGETLPPARVLMVSAPELEAKLLAENQLVGVDLPFKVLAFEHESGDPKAVYNNFDYLVSRYQLAENSALREGYDNVVAQTLVGTDQAAQSEFDNDVMQPDGLITIDSPYDFETTIGLVYQAITAQDETTQSYSERLTIKNRLCR